MLLSERLHSIMELSQQETSTSTSTSTSAAAQYPPEEPPFKSPDRVATTDDAEEIFSPTSAAALALSTLCGAATASFSRVSVSGGDASRQRPTSLSRTRLFNSQKKQNENSGNHNSNNYTSIRPSSSRQPVANVEPSISQQQQQPPYNPSPSASPRYYPSTKHPAAVGNFYPPPGPGGRQIPPRAAYQARAGYPHGAPYHSTEVSSDKNAMESVIECHFCHSVDHCSNVTVFFLARLSFPFS
jgi:hypothetical protein